MLSAVLAMLAANSPWAWLYDAFLDTPVEIRVGSISLAKPMVLWINEGLMAIFFLLIGLELKREFKAGELSTPSQIALPLTAALGGMLVPAVIYFLFNRDNPAGMPGWAIPTATDIAFALGVLSFFGSRIPLSLKIFLTALAIFDDLGAIVIIGVWYSGDLWILPLALAGMLIFALLLINLFNIERTSAYLVLGTLLWIAVLKSGVHATLAGVVVGLLIPFRGREGDSPVVNLEHALHPWVSFLILPIFGFANAGVYILDLSLKDLVQPISLGVILGLSLGKLLGIFSFSFLAISSGLVAKPRDASWAHILGISAIAGIGFTMSLFIGALAFSDLPTMMSARLGTLLGSLIAAILATAIFCFLVPKQSRQQNDCVESGQ